jgi:hypothetical protein
MDDHTVSSGLIVTVRLDTDVDSTPVGEYSAMWRVLSGAAPRLLEAG